MNKKRVGRQIAASVLLLTGSLAMMGSAQAALLGVLPGNPDIRSNNMAVEYTGGTFTISDTGSTTYNLFKDGSSSPLTATDYSFSVNLDAAGNLIGQGSLSIMNGATTLVAGSVTDFGWEFISAPVSGVPVTGKYDAIFTINSADPSLGFGDDGVMLASFDVQLDANAVDPWGSEFSSDPINAGIVDTAGNSIPEPTSLSLLLIGALGALGAGRRRRQRQAA